MVATQYFWEKTKAGAEGRPNTPPPPSKADMWRCCIGTIIYCVMTLLTTQCR